MLPVRACSQTRLPTFCSSIRSISSSTPRDKFYDIVISGGGLVGTAAACAIGGDPLLKHHKILLIEPRKPKIWDSPPEFYSNRVYSIAHGTKRFLTDIQALPTIENLRRKEVKRLQIWESASDASIFFTNRSGDNVSYIIEDDVISTGLWQRLKQLSNVDVLHGVSATDYDLPSRRNRQSYSDIDKPVDEEAGKSEDSVYVKLSDGSQIQTSLLIGADGPNSSVRKAMNVQHLSWSYKQKGIVATLHLAEPQDNSVAWQRFTSSGPIALLPLNEDRISLVWTTSDSHADELMGLPEDEFIDHLNRALWKDDDKSVVANSALRFVFDGLLSPFFGSFSSGRTLLPPSIVAMDQGSRASFPLGLGHSTQYVVPHVALIGDAAHRVHPLAGLGVNLGFGDVSDLVRNLKDAVSAGFDIHTTSYLLRYESDAQKRVVPVMASVDLLNRLYSTTLSPIVFLRSFGLSFVNSLEPLKHQIMKRASR